MTAPSRGVNALIDFEIPLRRGSPVVDRACRWYSDFTRTARSISRAVHASVIDAPPSASVCLIMDAVPCVALSRFRHLLATLADDADLVPVYRRLVSDSLTPVTAFHKIDAGRCACLFESVVGGEKVGRYSFLATEPFFEIEAYGSRVTTTPTRASRPAGRRRWSPGSSSAAIRWTNCAAGSRRSARPPARTCRRFAAARSATPATTRSATSSICPTPRPTTARCPTWRSPSTTRWSSSTTSPRRSSSWRWPGWTQPGDRRQAAYADACRRVDRAGRAACRRARATLQPFDIAPDGEVDAALPVELHARPISRQAVGKCVEYIRAGDIFQVVLSQRLEVPIHAHPFEIYRTLRVVNPSPFMFYVRTPSVTLVGSSPEIMVRVVDGKVTVRPLAGTRPRGATEEEDRRLAEELLADPKERAEHVMLVDLGRNDVGRVCRVSLASK